MGNPSKVPDRGLAHRLDAETSGWTGHMWAEPSESHLRSLMRTVHENPDGVVETKGLRAREDMVAQFSLQAMSKVIKAELIRLGHTGDQQGNDIVHGEL